MSSDPQRTDQIAAFLTGAGWGNVDIQWFDQDASTRRYARLTRPNGATAILMDAPPVEGDP